MALELTNVGAALSSPVRVNMLHAMGSGPKSMTALARAGGVSPATATHHVGKLLEAGLVEILPAWNRRLVSLRARELRLILAPEPQ